MKFFRDLVVISFLVGLSDCARIFAFFPTPSISHQVVFRALVKDLAARGHELTVLTTDPMVTENPNITQIDLHGSYETWEELNLVRMAQEAQDEDIVKKLFRVHSKVLDWQLSQPEVKAIIQSAVKKKFDVVIAQLMMKSVSVVFGELFDCPVIGINSLDSLNVHHELMGNVVNPAIHPELNLPFTHGQLSFTERAISLMFHFKIKLVYAPLAANLNNQLLLKHFPEMKLSVDDLESRVKLLMTNTNPALGLIRPLLPNTIQLGFMHIEPAKALPTGELKDFLDNSKNGVIYMSLGSNAKSKDLSREIIQTFLNVFAGLEFDVLWKFEAESLAGKPENVMISKWTPQQDVLAHKNVKLFITHGGLQSLEEAIDRMVPLIVLPFVGDQNVNAMRTVQKGIGVDLHLSSLTEAKLLEAIRETMKPKYKANIEKLRQQVYDQPMTSRERAVWWTEFVIRHKESDHLRYAGRLVPFYQKYWLDFIACGIFIAGIVITTLLLLTRKLRSLRSRKSKSD